MVVAKMVALATVQDFTILDGKTFPVWYNGYLVDGYR